VTKQGARARASSGWEVPRERCRGIAGSGALGRQGPFVFNAPRPPTCVSKSKNNSQNVKYENITRRDTSEVFFVTRIVTRLKPHACNRKAASTSTLTKRARPRERPQVTFSHPPRATTSERSFRPRRVEPSVTDTDPAERRARARVFAASCCSRRAGRHPRRSSQRTVPLSLRASCVSRTTSVASPYADRKHLAATRQPAQMDGQPPPVSQRGAASPS